VKYLFLSPAFRPVPHSTDLSKPNSPDLIFSDESSHSNEGHEQQEGKNSDCDPTFGAIFYSSELYLLTQGNLNDPVRDYNMPIKAVLLGSRLKDWNLLHQDTEICSFAIAKINSKNFFSQEKISYFMMIFAVL
jgi:hypothetical protein